MSDEHDDALPYLPPAANPGRDPDQSVPDPGAAPTVPPATTGAGEGDDDDRPPSPMEMAVRNVKVVPKTVDYGLPTKADSGSVDDAPGVPTLPVTAPSPDQRVAPPLPSGPPPPGSPAGPPSAAAPPGVPAAAPAPAPAEPDRPLTPMEMAVRNVPAARSTTVDYGLPSAPAAEQRTIEEWTRPELIAMSTSTTAMLIGRGLMVIAALLVGIAARRSAGAGGSERGEAFWPVTISAGVFVAVGLACFVFWSVQLAENSRRLGVRASSPRRVGWFWAIPVVWVAASALTYLRVDVDGDLNPLPGVAGLGFAVALAIPYARLQGVYRGLLRQPPLVWVSAFPLDLLAFGLVWWRLTSWPDPVTGADWDHVRLTGNAAFVAAAALVVNGLVFGWLAQRGNAGVYERLGRLEARYRPADADAQPQWFASGLQRSGPQSPVEARPLMNTTVLTGVVALFHVLWGLSTVALGIVLVRLAFDYDDRAAIIGETLEVDDSDADRVGLVLGTVAIVYVVTIIVHGVWAVLTALNARRVTVHAPNPATFGIVFAPMPVLVITGLLIGGQVGYWIVLAGLGTAFLALLLVNRMLMALSVRLGGELKGFSSWTLMIVLVYVVGFAENFFFSRAVSRLGFFATATFMQGVLMIIGGVIGFRAMQALEATLRDHRQTRRIESEPATPANA